MKMNYKGTFDIKLKFKETQFISKGNKKLVIMTSETYDYLVNKYDIKSHAEKLED